MLLGRNVFFVLFITWSHFQGEEKSFVGDESISVYLGNAGDLDLTLNGEKLAPLGERNQEIRKTFRAK